MLAFRFTVGGLPLQCFVFITLQNYKLRVLSLPLYALCQCDCYQLERRVRELRETRGASATVQLQRARTVVDPALSRGDEFIDPLGLG